MIGLTLWISVGVVASISKRDSYGCERGSSTVSPSAVAASLRAWSAEISVTGAKPASWSLLADFEGGGELHGVVGAQRVRDWPAAWPRRTGRA